MIYTLKNNNFTAKVDSLGAQLVSLKGSDDFERIWVGDAKYWTGQAPVLFPMVGALRGGKTEIDGAIYEMGQHGFARRREFTQVEQSAPDTIALTLLSDDETRKMYPFDFAFTVTYALTEGGYSTTFTVQNKGAQPLSFAVGGHPGFNIPAGEEAAFEDYTIVFEKPESQQCPAIVMGQGLIDPTNSAYTLEGAEIPLTHSLFYKDALVFENLNSQSVKVINKSTGHGVEMNFAGFPLFGIWSAANDGPYVCLEPWTGCATRTTEGDKFTEKHGMIHLPAGSESTHSFEVKIL